MLVIFGGFMYARFRVTKKQKNIIEKQKEFVDEKNKEVKASINYAKRLQEAILPSKESLTKNLKNGFILYKPKDVVSGDFYFMDVVEEDQSSNKTGNKLVYYVVADCTGHGVPGAMVSIVGANGLKRCIQEFKLRDTGEILDRLSLLVAENFSQSDEQIRDGMDIAICCVETNKMNSKIKVHYSGANNSLWIINPNRKFVPKNGLEFKNGGGFEIKPNKQSIGYTEDGQPYKTHIIDIEKGDTLYTFSDGYVDQFGGNRGKKFKSANLKKLLVSIQAKSMDEQKVILDDTFEKWRGSNEQIDDVCIIGVRF